MRIFVLKSLAARDGLGNFIDPMWQGPEQSCRVYGFLVRYIIYYDQNFCRQSVLPYARYAIHIAIITGLQNLVH